MKKLMVVAFVIATVPLFAQGTDSEPAFREFPQALGGYINSALTGGLSWQFWMGKVGVSLSAGGIYSTTYGTTLDYNIQAEVQYQVYGVDFTSWASGVLYVFGIAGHRGIIQAIYTPNIDPTTGGTYSPGAYTPHFALGIGIGIEPILFRHISFPIEFIYVGQYPLQLDPSVGGGLRYRY
jgi:hypothetical protein